MKMNLRYLTYILFYLSLIACLLLSNCIKDRKLSDVIANQTWVLPPITCEKNKSFGCLINDRVYLAFGLNSLRPYYYFKPPLKGTFSITAENRGNYDLREALHISLQNQVFDTGTYSLAAPIDSSWTVSFATRSTGGGPYTYYHCLTGMYGQIHFQSIDTADRKICGTFALDLVNEIEPYDTIRIRDGRFDVEFFY